MSDWDQVFLGVIAVATALMALVQIGAIVFLARVALQVRGLVTTVQQDIRPLIARANAIAEEASKTATLATAQAQKIDKLLTDLSRRVDETSAELREVVFHFVNAGVIGRYEATGFTRFLRVPSGAWIVDEWLLKLPRIAARQSSSGYTGPEYTLVGYDEHGGGIIYSARQASVVADSLNKKH